MKTEGGRLPLKQWAAVLCPVLLYLLLGLGVRMLLLRAGLDEETAGEVCACAFPIPAVLWYFYREGKPHTKQMSCSRVSGPRMALELVGMTICLALTAAWAARRFAAPAAPAPVSMLAVLGFGIAGPVTEEIVYRGIVFRRGEVYFGAGWAALLSTVLFGFAHQPLSNVCVSLAAGFLFCLLYVRWRTLFAPILVHIGANLLSFAELGRRLPEGILLLGLLGMASMLVLPVLTYFREKRRKTREKK